MQIGILDHLCMSVVHKNHGVKSMNFLDCETKSDKKNI